MPDNASLDITGPITIAAWVNFDSFSGDRVIVAKWDPSANQSYFFGNNTDSNELIFFVSDDGSSFSYAEVSTNAALATGTWYHVAATWNSTDGAKLYKNGTLLTMSPFGSNISAIYSGNESLKIGATEATATSFFDGRTDEVRVSNKARSAEWIAAQYNNHDNPSTFVVEGTPETP
ncbi:LamG domain-containing protein [candidate division KSB1 bacterium]|nr:LamG domain-containing protein [candidate division KSB1 bacterium]